MEKQGAVMDKTGKATPSPPPLPAGRSALLSRQVTEGRYFFLELAPPRARRVALAFGGCERCRPDYAVRREAFAFAGVELVLEGEGEVFLDGRRHALEPGAAFAYGPSTRVEIRTNADRPMLKYFLCLTGAGVAARLRQAGLRPGTVRKLGAAGEVRNVFDDLVREGQWHSPLTREVCAVLGELLLLKLAAAIRDRGAADPARGSFIRCKALIDANLERLVSLEEIAAAAHLDVSTVGRLFRRFQGTSPYQYLLRRKMNLAAEFLIETGAPVKEAAQRVGFADPYHFSRVFRAVHGVPPSHLRLHPRGG